MSKAQRVGELFWDLNSFADSRHLAARQSR